MKLWDSVAWGAIALGLIIIMYKPINTIRGFRNNNPLNIRENDRINYDWEGEAFADSDGEFEEFTSPEYGIRAATRILKSYQKRGLDTVPEIIGSWAPEIENDTQGYIENILDWTGFNMGDYIGVSKYPVLLAAMIRQENGSQPYSMELINQGVSMA